MSTAAAGAGSNEQYRNSRSVVSSSTSYHFVTSSFSTRTSPTTTQASSISTGIHSQPYRNYLTERNHFYHSASQPASATFTSTSSSLRPSTIISHIQSSTQQQQQQQQTTRAGSPTGIQPKSAQQSLLASLGVHKHQNGGSKQSLNSAAEKMAAKQQHRSNSSLAVDGRQQPGKGSSLDDDDENDYDLYRQSTCSKLLYWLLWLVAQAGLFGAVGLLLYWFFSHDRGFAYQNDKRRMFNLHAFLMLTGFIFVNGQSMLIYKTYLCCKKIYNKIAHAFCFVLSIGLVSFGFLIGFQAQSIASSPDQNVQHFYSLHSWIGLLACGLFALQFLFGFVTFLVLLCCDRSTASYRARFLPTHITFGLVIFVLAVAACLAGLLQTARSRLSGPTLTEPGRADYKDMRLEDLNIFLNSGIVINLVGAFLLLLAIVLPYLVLNFGRNRIALLN